jgi:pimeloyl-ACP methyl ester carboxylesterase
MATLSIRRRLAAWGVASVVVASAAASAAASLAVSGVAGAQSTTLPLPGPDSGRELVVVAHGLGRSSWSMRPMIKALEKAGYDVMPFGYSSYCCSIAEIGAKMQRRLDERMTPQHTRVHFVGHSLGNIIVRWVLTRDTLPERVGRVVMLAPPNQGAHAANTFTPWAGWLLRPMRELQADTAATVRKLPPVRIGEIGVIAARDDRTVKIPETMLPEARAHVQVPGGHSFIMRRDDVHALTVHFLRTGQFTDSVARAAAPPF